MDSQVTANINAICCYYFIIQYLINNNLRNEFYLTPSKEFILEECVIRIIVESVVILSSKEIKKEALKTVESKFGQQNCIRNYSDLLNPLAN